MRTVLLSSMAIFLLAGCGDPDAADQPADGPDAAPAEPAALETPDWIQVDDDAETVRIDLIAGETGSNNYWNFNGFHGGQGEIVVPEGYEVTIYFENRDPNMAHSVGVGELEAQYPSTFSEVTPIFEGAVSSNPTSSSESTLPGESEEFTFVASEAGEFALICYVPAHAVTGMWMPFTVSAEGEYGVRS